MNDFPVWIEYSGLPGALCESAGKGSGGILKKIIELDIQCNTRPEVIEISIENLSMLTGFESKDVKRFLKKFQKLSIINVFTRPHLFLGAVVCLIDG